MTTDKTVGEGSALDSKKYQADIEQALQCYARTLGCLGKSSDIPVGQSPKRVIWTRNKAKLYFYDPVLEKEKRYKIPILIIYALINRAYILDLRPGASLIEYLVRQGYDVYLLDWGAPELEDRNLTLDNYIQDYMPKAVKQVLRHSSEQAISLMGYCMGATLATIFTALHSELPIKNLMLLAAPIDFSEKGLLRTWLDSENFNLDQFVEAYDVIPAEIIDFGSKMLKPYQNFVATYQNLADRLGDNRATESWLSMNKWVNDGVGFAGAAFKQWVEEFYRNNRLVAGQLKIDEQRVNLANIKANLLNIIADKDHITLPSQSTPIMHLVSSLDKKQIILPGGHVGLVVGRNAHTKLWPALNHWLSSRSAS